MKDSGESSWMKLNEYLNGLFSNTVGLFDSVPDLSENLSLKYGPRAFMFSLNCLLQIG